MANGMRALWEYLYVSIAKEGYEVKVISHGYVWARDSAMAKVEAKGAIRVDVGNPRMVRVLAVREFGGVTAYPAESMGDLHPSGDVGVEKAASSAEGGEPGPAGNALPPEPAPEQLEGPVNPPMPSSPEAVPMPVEATQTEPAIVVPAVVAREDVSQKGGMGKGKRPNEVN